MRKSHLLRTRLLAGALSASLAFSLTAPPVLAGEISTDEVVTETVSSDAETEEVFTEDTGSEAAAEDRISEDTATEDIISEDTATEDIISEDSTTEDTVTEEAFETAEEDAEAPIETMTSASIGGVTYYYADTTDDAENTVYQMSMTTGRGPSAVTNVYSYTKSDLTQAGETGYYYIAAQGATALSGTLYGCGEGNVKTYKEIYEGLGVSLPADPAYDAVSSATKYTSYHAKDVSSVAVYGEDSEGNKAITGIQLSRAAKTVDAVAYVEASILKAAGAELTAEQTETLNITLKKNPMTAASETTVTPVLKSASYTTSRYGTGEFAIVPDDTVEGYVWSEYWDNMYAATVSDGTTTVGAVHWIDMYGEESTSGGHYNKVELALNNGTSLGANAAAVSRYSAFYDTVTGNVKAGTYTITLYSEGYEPLTAEVTIPAETMKSASIGGLTYYYADVTGDADNTVYQESVSSRAGTTIYNYTKADLTQLKDTNYYYIVADGKALEGTVYAYTDGTEKTYKEIYNDLKVNSTDDAAYDVVSSATKFTSFHAKDISSIVNYGTDTEGNKTIKSLNIGRGIEAVGDAADYVEACILKAEGAELTDAQAALAAKTLKSNPTVGAAENAKTVKLASASYTTSKYGSGEFAIVPDDTVDGYVWNEYWDNMYAATVSDGTTTVGAVHWIDLYGELATSGYHYNKVELALNNGTSLGTNAAAVSRYSAFYDETGNVKGGTYTITLYSEGYEPLTAEVKVDYTAELQTAYAEANDAMAELKEADYTSSSWAAFKAEIANAAALLAKDKVNKADAEAEVTKLANTKNALTKKTAASISISAKTATYNGKAVTVAKASTKSNGKVTYTYYSDSACKKALKSAPVSAGTYYAKASVAASGTFKAAVSRVVKVTIKKAAQPLTVKAAKTSIKRKKKKAQTIKLTVGKAQGKVTYVSSNKKYVTVSAKGVITVKKAAKAGKYIITVKAAGNGNYNAGYKKVTITVKK